jgi:hypothetical protein
MSELFFRSSSLVLHSRWKPHHRQRHSGHEPAAPPRLPQHLGEVLRLSPAWLFRDNIPQQLQQQGYVGLVQFLVISLNFTPTPGATLTLYQASNGRSFGGFIEYSWTSRGGYIQSGQAFVFRFACCASWVVTPNSHRAHLNSINVNNVDLAYQYNLPNNNINTVSPLPCLLSSALTVVSRQVAAYDVSSYCPTFGGTNDLNVINPCQSASFSANYYQNAAQGYSSSWLCSCDCFGS